MPNGAFLSTWKTYQAAWSDISAEERKELLRDSVSANCVYADPTAECRGIDELISKIEDSQKQYPGASFENTKFLDHHDQGLSNWTMHDATGGTVAVGTSYARFGQDGLLVQMTGFFEPAPKAS